MSDDFKKMQIELGGSFFELIEFSLTRRVQGKTIQGNYGVNVAKVREVVRMPRINPLSSRVKGIAGIFELRGVPIPAVNLGIVLGEEDREPTSEQQIIVTEFSQKRAGFIVDATKRIRKISWEKVLPPSADAGSFISGMTLIEDKEFLFILDLERILLSLESHGVIQAPAPQETRAPLAPAPERGPRILLVEDSQFIRNGVKLALQRGGYHVTEAQDGAEALAILEKVAGNPNQEFKVMVTDIEMPKMDGLTLTRKVREHPVLSELPVLFHTSLSGKANQAQGHAVGANGYVIKNDFSTLFELLKEICGENANARSA